MLDTKMAAFMDMFLQLSDIDLEEQKLTMYYLLATIFDIANLTLLEFITTCERLDRSVLFYITGKSNTRANQTSSFSAVLL